MICHQLKNQALRYSQPDAEKKIIYARIMGKDDEANKDFKVEANGSEMTVTDLETGVKTTCDIESFNLIHHSLVKMQAKGQEVDTVQFLGSKDDLYFDFYYAGGPVKTQVFDEAQYRLSVYMAEPVKVDHSKSVLSPMPGAVVQVMVEVGQTVVDGQDLCVIEAMKMQNLLKSERDGVIKSINVKAGDSVAVDELLIEFEWSNTLLNCWQPFSSDLKNVQRLRKFYA